MGSSVQILCISNSRRPKWFRPLKGTVPWMWISDFLCYAIGKYLVFSAMTENLPWLLKSSQQIKPLLALWNRHDCVSSRITLPTQLTADPSTVSTLLKVTNRSVNGSCTDYSLSKDKNCAKYSAHSGSARNYSDLSLTILKKVKGVR